MDRDPRTANESFDPTPAPDGFPESRNSTPRNPGQKDLDTDASLSGKEAGRIEHPPEDPKENVPRNSK